MMGDGLKDGMGLLQASYKIGLVPVMRTATKNYYGELYSRAVLDAAVCVMPDAPQVRQAGTETPPKVDDHRGGAERSFGPSYRAVQGAERIRTYQFIPLWFACALPTARVPASSLAHRTARARRRARRDGEAPDQQQQQDRYQPGHEVGKAKAGGRRFCRACRPCARGRREARAITGVQLLLAVLGGARATGSGRDANPCPSTACAKLSTAPGERYSDQALKITVEGHDQTHHHQHQAETAHHQVEHALGFIHAFERRGIPMKFEACHIDDSTRGRAPPVHTSSLARSRAGAKVAAPMFELRTLGLSQARLRSRLVCRSWFFLLLPCAG